MCEGAVVAVSDDTVVAAYTAYLVVDGVCGAITGGYC